MTTIVRPVITVDGSRQPDYDGAWSLVEDRGDTMLIAAHDVDGMTTATLNAVLGVWTLEDAANTVGLTPADLVHEAEAWAVGGKP